MLKLLRPQFYSSQYQYNPFAPNQWKYTRMKISVIIPTYNRQEQTVRAIESVKAKNYSDVEIIVVDDASPAPFEYNDRGVNIHVIAVTIYRCDINAGQGVGRAFGVAHSSGEYIAFLDSDDLFGEYWLDAVINEMAIMRTIDSDKALFVGREIPPHHQRG